MTVYGDLIVFGTNGKLRNSQEKGRRKSKIRFFQRATPNGVKPGKSSKINDCLESTVVQDFNRHSVSYTLSRHEAVVVEYVPDDSVDMFQIGRSTDEHIDFIVAEYNEKSATPYKTDFDKILANSMRGENLAKQEQALLTNNMSHLASNRGAFFKKPLANIFSAIHNNDNVPQKVNSKVSSAKPADSKASNSSNSDSTVSRFACRIYIDRKPPYTARIYAAGFDSSKNIFLGERAIKWSKNSYIDGLTTNGVMILKPDTRYWPINESSSRKLDILNEEDDSKVSDSENEEKEKVKSSSNSKNLEEFSNIPVNNNWREVSVCGSIYELRKNRSAPTPSNICQDDDNVLVDGTLIDLCGVTLLWRSYNGLKLSPTFSDICSMVKSLNMCRIQCPVRYQTLHIPKPIDRLNNENKVVNGDSKDSLDRRPFVYLNCGHVHGYHDWKASQDKSSATRTCPLCLQPSLFVPLYMGQETAFYLNKSPATYCFNPCGHMASKETVLYWYSVNMPNRNNFKLHPRCPFCSVEIKQAPVKLLFQSDIDEEALFEMFSKEKLELSDFNSYSLPEQNGDDIGCSS